MVRQNCGDTEGKPEPGKERPVQAEEEHGWKSRHAIRSREADRKEVGKQAGQLSRKAAIVLAIPVP